MRLSRRGSQVLVLVCQGLGNAEIAAALSISVNTVKADILATYRKIGATTRSDAVIWGVTHGFAPEVHHRTPTPRRTALRPHDTTARPGVPVMADVTRCAHQVMAPVDPEPALLRCQSCGTSVPTDWQCV